MTNKELKEKIADIIMDAIEEYNNNEINRPMIASVYAGKILSFIDSLPEEPVCKDLEEAAIMHYKDVMEYEVKTGLKMANMTSFKDGAQWKEKHLWKDAKGDDLPEIDRVVIALIQYREDAGMCRIVFAHRPNPDGWDGRSGATGEDPHYEPETYDKGGWNMPNVKYWLDVKLPEEIEE